MHAGRSVLILLTVEFHTGLNEAEDMSALTWRVSARIAGLTVALLTIPLMAMQFTTEVNWGAGDFAAAGALLFGASAVYCIAARRARSAPQRVAVAALVLFVFGTVWAELAVGLFT